MLVNKKNLQFSLLYSLVAIAPAVMIALYGSTSMAAGLGIYCAVLFFLYLGQFGLLAKMPIGFYFSALIAMLFIVTQSILTTKLMTIKSYASFVLLFFVVVTSILGSFSIARIGDRVIHDAIKLLLFFSVIVFIVNKIFNLKFSGYTHANAVVPFLEPSHYALFAGPVFLSFFVFANNDKIRLVLLICLSIESLMLPSATMLGFVLLMTLIKFNLSKKKYFLMISCLVVIATVIMTNPYFSERISLNPDSQNLSVLVYLQGIDDLFKSLVDTHLMGLGFQMLGTQPPSTFAALIADQVNGGSLNREDGSFLAAKLVAEFGILGIAVILYCCYRAYISFFYLTEFVKGTNVTSNSRLVFAHCICFSFVIELFVRGYGYFSPGVFVYLVSIAYVANYKPSSVSHNLHRSGLVGFK